MKQGWENKNLGDVVEVLDNLRKPITKRDRIEGEYPYYGATGILSYVHNYIFSEKLVLIGEDGAKWLSGDNTSFIAEGKYWVNNHAHVIRPIRKIILDEWIVYFLNFSDLTPFITGMTVPKLNQEKMRSIPIPLPPLPEQQRIVAILDEAFAAIAKARENAEQNLKNAKELFESYLQGVFEKKGEGWEVKTIQEITKVINGYAFSSNDFQSTNSIKSVKITNVGVKEFVEESENYLPEKFRETLKEFQVREGDIVIALTRTIISAGLKVAVIPKSYDGAFINQRVAAMTPKEKLVNQEFLYFFLCSKAVEKYVLEHVNTLMQPNLSINDLKKMPVYLPSLEDQQTIVRQLDALRAETQKLEAVYQQKLADLEELKKSILQKAFAGELTDKSIAS